MSDVVNTYRVRFIDNTLDVVKVRVTHLAIIDTRQKMFLSSYTRYPLLF